MKLSKSARILSMAALAVASSVASAAPVVGPSDQSFYTPPATLPAGVKGDVIWYRQTSVKLGDGAPAVNAWTVMYYSTDSLGQQNVVTGTVIVPKGLWLSFSPRPVVSYAVGTHGLAQKCAPSVQLNQGTDYEASNVAAALKAGYAVLVTDYAGYTTGKVPTYLAGASQGQAVLDIVKAAAQIPNSGVKTSAKTAIWGYSQGGQSAAWAGQLMAAYAPELNIVGVAAGGVPGDFLNTAANLDGRNGSAFLLSATIGLAEQYPDEISFDLIANETGQAAAVDGKQMCVFEALPYFHNRPLTEFTKNNRPLEYWMRLLPPVRVRITDQDLGKSGIPVPVYQYHGQADQFIPLGQAYALKNKYCALGTKVSFDLYPSEHIATQFQGSSQALAWISDRVAGKAAPSTCGTAQPEPTSTANDNTGNLVVSLKQWSLIANVGLKTLGQTVNMPAASTFSADTDITAQQLKNGKLVVPDFVAKLNILLPIDVKMAIKPTQDTTGSASLSTAGILKISGTQYANITLQTVGSLGINIPTGCTTSKPVEFPLNFEGPVAALGNGKISFSGTTSFPSLNGCGLYGPLLSTLMSGSGQTYSFTVAPPAPVKN